MDKEYRKRITAFLSDYLNISPEMFDIYDILRKDSIKYCIKYLIDNKVFTVESLKKEAVKYYYVIIADDLLPD